MSERRRVTAQDIADLAGVTKTTVSYALNGTGSVSRETTERILSYANKLGYRVNKLAAATRTGKTKTVGLVVPDLSYPYFPEMAQAVHKAAHENGYAVFLVDSNQSIAMEFEGVQRLMDYRVDGIMWAPIRDESIERLDLNIPTVLMDRNIEGFSSVYADTFSGGRMQTQHLLDMGHRKIGLISGPSWSPHANLRKDGALSALDSKTVLEWTVQKEYGIDFSPNDVRTILESSVTAVIAANDLFAIDVMQIYREAGIRIPDDVSIIGFDNIEWGRFVTPALTTIHPPKRNIGKGAFELLCKFLETPEHSDEQRVLEVSLVERESVRRI